MSKPITTSISLLTLHKATKDDCPLILSYISKLAIYEKLEDMVTATVPILEDSLFIRKKAEVIIAKYDNVPVGFMLFFHNYSTFRGKPGIYLEDLFIDESMRNKGIGKELFNYLAHLTIKRDCYRLEWACLDWNEPSIAFYKKLGAMAMDEWTVYRLTGDSLLQLAKKFKTDTI